MTAEIRRKDAIAFLNCQVKAQNMMRKRYTSLGDIKVVVKNKLNNVIEIQLVGVIELCNLVGIPYVRNDWDGNKVCDSDWDVVYFDYKGYRFFELVDKEDDHEGQ